MDAERFPAFIRALPSPASPLARLRGWMLGGGAQPIALFYEMPDGAEIPEHAHGAQWGVVLAGQVDFTIGGELRSYRAGESYAIEAGAPHAALIHPGFAGIDVFADGDRYTPAEPSP